MAFTYKHGTADELKPMQQGDTFNMMFVYKEDGVATLIPDGYDLFIGFYDKVGRLLHSGTTADGSIVLIRDRTYRMQVGHEASMKMLGKVTVEITLANTDGEVVDHALDIITLNFMRRYNNETINKYFRRINGL